jgi:hypothetical protein
MTTQSSASSASGIGSPISNEAYNVISALQAKLEGLEAFRKYSMNGDQQLWQQLTQLDTQAVQILTNQLEQLAKNGQLKMGQPGQTS